MSEEQTRDGKADIKVTDKRMFTPDGTLREGYRHLDRPSEGQGPSERPKAEEAAPPVPESPVEPPPSPPVPEGRHTVAGSPGLQDLVALLAEPASVYMGDVPMGDGRSIEDLDLARLHIDLLSVLKEKTAGNLTLEEQAFVDDVLYRLRMRYVQKRG